MAITYEELHTLLVEKQHLIQNHDTPVHNYQSLKTLTIEQELADEIEVLLNLLDQGLEAFHQGFLDRCKHRTEQNAGTCLSLFAMPNGECNQLYWQLAERLFEPKTMGEMLKLLLPNGAMQISYEVTTEVSLESLRERVKNPVFHFEKRNFANLNQKPSPTALSEFVGSGNLFFDVTNLAQFDFTVHEKFFNALQKQYPELAEALYQHNDAFKKLRQNLLAISKGQSPREVIKEFIQQLLLGGETLTGEHFASLDTQRAVTDFFVYLESLPSSLKKALLELETSAGFSLNGVCEHLRDENCVEQAASHLQDILNNKANETILDTRPDLSPEQLQSIRKLYGRSHALPTVSDSPTALPTHYLKKNLEPLVIEDMHVLLDLLLAFPPSYYTLLFKYAEISCEACSLGDMIEDGLFLSEQLSAINQALVDNMEKVGGFSECLEFALIYKNDQLLKLLLSILYQEEEPVVFFIEQLGGLSASLLMVIAHKNYELLKLILTSLPLEERLAALQTARTFDGDSILDFATVNMPGEFHWILDLLPEEHRLTAITTKRPTVLSLIGNLPEALSTTLSLLPEKERLTALTAEESGKSGLLRASFHPEALKVMLALLPTADRLSAIITGKGFDNQNAIERITLREEFEAILSLLPDTVAPVNATHSTEQSEKTVTLYDNIRQLKSYGLELYEQITDKDAETTGKKAICLALSLDHFASHFINAQTDAEQHTAQKKLLKELQQSMPIQEQALLKPVRANIALTAFAYAPALSEELGTLVENGLFDSNQLDDLNQSIVDNIERLGIYAGLQFALTYKNYELLRLLLTSFAPEKRLEALRIATTKADPAVLNFAMTKVVGDISLVLDFYLETHHLTAIAENRSDFLYFIKNYPEALCTLLDLLPESDRLDAVTEKIALRRNPLQLTTSREQFDELLKRLPALVTPTKTAYSPKKNEQIEMLYENIKQLKSYGLELYNPINDKKAQTEGKKATCLALSLSHFANRFINAQSNEERQIAQKAFQLELQQGMLDMQHRALWKPVLANLAIAATGLGLLVIVGKLLFTGSAFFMQTERHKKIDQITSNFKALQVKEETHLPSPTA